MTNSENDRISNKSVRGEERKAEPTTAAISNATTHATELLRPEW
jgi:hypothetical protein